MLNTTNPDDQGPTMEIMTDKDFADFGLHDLVYVHRVEADRALNLFPEIDHLPDGEMLYAVHAADGTPILLAEDLEAASSAAEEHMLTLQYVN